MKRIKLAAETILFLLGIFAVALGISSIPCIPFIVGLITGRDIFVWIALCLFFIVMTLPYIFLKEGRWESRILICCGFIGSVILYSFIFCLIGIRNPFILLGLAAVMVTSSVVLWLHWFRNSEFNQ